MLLMQRNLIGLATDDLRLPVKAGLRQALDLGFGAVEIGAASDEVNPRTLSASGRRHLGLHVRNLGLALAALGADPANARRLDEGNIDERAARARAVLEMAGDAGAPAVTLALGPLIDPATGQPFGPVREILDFLADRADRVGVTLALRSAGDDPRQVAKLLSAIACPALRICVDPASLVIAGHDPAETVVALAGHVGLSHAHDASRAAALGGGQETVLGRGEVDFAGYLRALDEAGYAGPHIVRRTDSVNPVADLAASKEFVESLTRSDR